MTNTTKAKDPFELDLMELCRFALKKPLRLITLPAAFFIIAAALTFIFTPKFSSHTTLTPSNNGISGLASNSDALGTVTSLVGISVGMEDSLTTETLAIAESRSFILQFISRNNLKEKIFFDDWLEETRSWKEPGIFKTSVQKLKNVIDPHFVINVSNEPSDETTFETFSDKHININQNIKTGLITISIMAYSPKDAASWTSNFVSQLNQYMMKIKKDEAEKSIEYLTLQLEKNPSVEIQTTIYHLIESNTKTLMMASISDEFALKTIDPSYVPEKKTSPKRIIIAAAGGLVGTILVFTLSLIRYSKESYDQK